MKGFDNFLTIVEINGEKEASRIIDSDAEATLYNKDGIVVIGKDAYKYKFEKVIKVLNATKTDIASLSAFEPKNLQSMSVILLERKINGQIITSKNGRLAGILSDYCINQYESYKRIVGESNVSRSIGGAQFNSIVIQTKSQKRQAWIWWAHDIAFVKIEGNAYLYDPATGIYKGIGTITPEEGENKNKVSRDLSSYCPASGTVAYTATGKTSITGSAIQCSESESAF